MARPLRLRALSEERAAELLALCRSIRRHGIIEIDPDEPEDLEELARALERFRRSIGRSAGAFSTPRNAPCPCGSGSKYKNCCARTGGSAVATKKSMAIGRGGASRKAETIPRCGLCGASGKLVRTECCGQWICDDEDEYELFSYARNSCSRNHRRYTLCGQHHAEEHDGHWKDCAECREDIETEMYVYYGTNDYNFEKLENPPPYVPTLCGQCGTVIRLGEESYMMSGDGYFCERCQPMVF
jgi:hypothetical protein